MPISWVERLFDRLSGFYGSKFGDLWRGCDIDGVKRTWAEALACYSTDEIKRGLEACMMRIFPPTLPEFLLLCRPPLDYERAYVEAIEQMRRRDSGDDAWSSPAVFWAAVALGSDLAAHPYAAIKGRWRAALDDANDGVRSGRLLAEIPPRRAALPAPGQTSVPPDVAKQRIAAMRDMLAAKMTDQV